MKARRIGIITEWYSEFLRGHDLEYTVKEDVEKKHILRYSIVLTYQF